MSRLSFMALTLSAIIDIVDLNPFPVEHGKGNQTE